MLLTIVGTIGRVTVLEEDPRAVFQRSVAFLRPRANVLDSRYLALTSQSPQFKGELARATNQSSQAGVYLGKLKEIEFPLPPVTEQRRIAAILDHADTLRAKRRQVLAHLDALTRSIFNEMFPSGHFTAMPAGTLMPEMRNGLSPASGGSYSAKVLTLSAVTQGAFDPSAVKAGAFAFEPPAEKRISERDFLMCRGNGNKSLVGVGTYSRENRPDLVFPDTVIAGAVDTSLVTLPFLEAAWKHRDVRAQVEAVARTTNGTYKVNQGTLSGVLVPVPPLDEQETFGARIEHVNRQRASALAATSACDELFASLQARAFSGEL